MHLLPFLASDGSLEGAGRRKGGERGGKGKVRADELTTFVSFLVVSSADDVVTAGRFVSCATGREVLDLICSFEELLRWRGRAWKGKSGPLEA